MTSVARIKHFNQKINYKKFISELSYTGYLQILFFFHLLFIHIVEILISKFYYHIINTV